MRYRARPMWSRPATQPVPPKSQAPGDLACAALRATAWADPVEVASAFAGEAYACVRAKASGAPAAKAKANGHAVETGPSADAQAIMACMTAGFSQLEKSIAKLAKARS